MYKAFLFFVLPLSTHIALSDFVYADGLSDLKAALQQLQSKTPITAIYRRSFNEISDADSKKDRREKSGQVSLLLKDAEEEGLQVVYSQQVLDRIEQEKQQQTQDEEINTPTLNAVNGVNAPQLSRLLSSSNSLLRRIDMATFIDEQSVEAEGKSLRLLRFTLPLEAIINDKKVRKYVRRFEGLYHVLINEEGIPLETTTEFKGKGRAFIVLSITAQSSELSEYQVIKGRLVRTHNEYSNSFSSSFGDNEVSGYNTLTIIDNPRDTNVASILAEQQSDNQHRDQDQAL